MPWPLVMFVAFLVVPLAELAVILQVRGAIGLLPTLALLLGMSVAGAWLVRREGRSAWRRLRAAFGRAQVPAVEVVDGALVLVGGTLLLTPGFVTDVLGLLLVIPLTRGFANRAVRARVRTAFGLPGAGSRQMRRPRSSAPRRGGDPVDVEVVAVERTTPPRDVKP